MTRIKRTNDELEFIHSHGLSLRTRELFLHSSLLDNEDPGVDYRMANIFMKNLKILEHASTDPIVIYQYSVGGEWSAGMAVYDMIVASPCQFVFVCCGLSASMGSILPHSVLGKGLRVAYPNCDWIVHEGYCGDFASVKQHIAVSQYNQYLLEKMLNIYINACSTGVFFKGRSRSYIKKYIQSQLDQKEDWHFGAPEALKLGFIDGIIGQGDFTDIDTIKGML